MPRNGEQTRFILSLRVHIQLFYFCALAFLSGQLFAQQRATLDQNKGAIVGHVVNSQSGEPLPDAEVILHWADYARRDGPLRTKTGQSGQYEFLDLEPGHYSLWAHKSGFDTRWHTTSEAWILLSAGEVATGVKIDLTPQISISGRVVDEAGKPVPYVGVVILREQYIDGRKQLYPTAETSQTNERGEFQLAGVWTGPVVLQFMPWRVLRPTPTGVTDTAPDMDYFTSYFPGTTDASQATRIELAPGAQRSGLTGILLKARVSRITGRVRDHTGQLAKNCSVTLLPTSSPWASLLGAHGTEAPSGSFELQHVHPGSYRLIVETNEGMVHRESITLESGDINDLDVRLPSPVPIEGEVLIKGGVKVDPRLVQVSLWIVDGAADGPSLVPRRMLKASDGTFAFDNGVLPGKYRITASLEDTVPPTNIPESVYVERIQYGDHEVTGAPVEITARSSRIRVTLNDGTGSASGIVMKNSALARRATVWLLNADKRRRLDQVSPQTARTDQHARFTIEHIPPGDYLAFAFEETEQGFWRDEERFEKFASRAKIISIARNGTTNVNLRITPLPEG